VRNADFVLEAVPEIMDLKKETFQKLDRFTPPHAILASNTSGLSITEMGSVTRRPEKTIIVHGINPPTIIPVVEIVRETRRAMNGGFVLSAPAETGEEARKGSEGGPGVPFQPAAIGSLPGGLHCWKPA